MMPDEDPEERWQAVFGRDDRTGVRAWFRRRAYLLRSPMIGFALVLFAIGSIISSIGYRITAGRALDQNSILLDRVEHLEKAIDCRAGLRSDVDALQNRRLAAVAEGLADLGDNNDAGIREQTLVIHSLNGRIEIALDRLDHQAKICGTADTVTRAR